MLVRMIMIMILCWPRLTIRVTTLCFYILSCEASQPQHSLSDHRTQKRCGLSQEEECPLYIRACVCGYIPMYKKRINICAYREREESSSSRQPHYNLETLKRRCAKSVINIPAASAGRGTAPRALKLWNDLSLGREKLICLNCVSSTFVSRV